MLVLFLFRKGFAVLRNQSLVIKINWSLEGTATQFVFLVINLILSLYKTTKNLGFVVSSRPFSLTTLFINGTYRHHISSACYSYNNKWDQCGTQGMEFIEM